MILYEDLAPTARAAKITYMLLQDGRMTVSRIKEAAGYKTAEGVRKMMISISMTVPIYQPEPGVWAMLDEFGHDLTSGRRTDAGAIDELR